MSHFVINSTKGLLFIITAFVITSCRYFDNSEKTLGNSLEISKVMSSYSTSLSILEEKGKLYMAYYDSINQVTLATYDLETGDWEYNVLPLKVERDSTDYISMTFDKRGYLHLSGEIGSSRLVYFRSYIPYDIHSMRNIGSMVGEDECRVTAPSFMYSPDGELVFHYRYEDCGIVSEIYNVYNDTTKKWRRFSEKTFTDTDKETHVCSDLFGL